MRRRSRPDEQEWRSAKDRFQEGATVQGTVCEVVSFGLLVDLPGTAVQGVVLAPGFTDPTTFARRGESHPSGSVVELIVLGASEGRLQIDLILSRMEGACGS